MPKVFVDAAAEWNHQVKFRWEGQSGWWRGGACLILLVSALTGCIPSSDAPPGPNRAADLANLELSEGALSPAFGPDELNYTVSVGSNVSAITITPTVADARATVKINNNPAQSGQPFGPINLELGTNPPITILVDAPGISKTYTIVVTRAPNADLQALELSAGALAPAFSPNETNYMVETGFGTQSTTVTARVADDTSTIKINGASAQSGQPFGPIPLNVGSNNGVTIRVTAANGVTKDYQVTVLRTGTTNLSGLSTSAGAIAPAFNPNTLAYTVSTGFATTQTTITATTADNTALVTVKFNNVAQGPIQGGGTFGPFPLDNVGPGNPNNFSIEVTSPTPTVQPKTYSVAISRAAPSVDLSSLTVSAGSLAPAFNPGTLSYTVSTGFTTDQTTLTATTADNAAAVTVNAQGPVQGGGSFGPFPLSVGANNFTIVVTGQAATPKTYRVSVTRQAPGANADLSNLTVSPGSLSPTFNSNTLNYTVDVPSTVGSVTVTATKSDPNASVTINGVASSSRSVTLGAPGSATPVSIVVLAQDGVTTKNYLVTVNRLGANNANLSNLTVTPGTLQPGFTSNNTGPYTVDVASTVGSVTVTATKADTNATVSINGVTGTSRTITLPAAPSTTQVNVQVIAQDGVTSKTYVVNVNRMGANNANLSNLTVTPGTLSPGFTAGNTGPYSVNVSSTVGSVTVTATKADTNASVFINGVAGNSRVINLPPAPSTTEVNILVIAQDGVTNKTYVVNVNRDAPLSNNANLTALDVYAGATATPPALGLTPPFSSTTTSYTTAQVANTVTQVTIVATRADTNATMTIGGMASTGQTTVDIGAAGSTTAISIVVTPPSGPADAKTYTVNVPKAS